MFYTIHRAIKLLLMGVVFFVAWEIYERRAIFDPAWVWVEVWDNGGFHVAEGENVGGRVVQVVNSQTFVMRARAGAQYNVRLLGLREPSRDPALEGKRRNVLEDLIKGKWVTVEKLYSNANNLGGVVWVQGTNVNAELVARGLHMATRDTVKGMPKDDEYSLLYAAKHPVTSQ